MLITQQSAANTEVSSNITSNYAHKLTSARHKQKAHAPDYFISKPHCHITEFEQSTNKPVNIYSSALMTINQTRFKMFT